MTAAENRHQLFDLANIQHGLFTSKQAESIGFERANFQRYLGSGEWVLENRGLYRLVNYPETVNQEYMKWYLWTRNKNDIPQGAFSYETALFLYDLTDVLPTKFHITVPRDFRRTTATPAILKLHFKNLRPEETEFFQGFFVTTPIVTIEQVASDASIPTNVAANALSLALARGVVTKEQVDQRRKVSETKVWDKLLDSESHE